MRNKYFYPIFKLKTKSWIRYWLLKKTEFKGKLSEILTGFSFNLQNTLNQKFVKFEIEGNSIQDGEPSPENEVPIKSAGENVNINSSELESGSIANGNNYASNDNLRSKDYISVQPSTNYAFGINGALNRVVVSMYDENKDFINTDGTEGYISSNGLFTTYSNAKYIRYRSYTADKALFQNGQIKIEQGSTATPYSPYGMGSITEKIVNGNLFDGIVEQGGYLYNGSSSTSTKLLRGTQYIPIISNENYILSNEQNLLFDRALFYDKTKTLIIRSDTINSNTILSNIIPSNAKYMRNTFSVDFSIDIVPANMKNAQIEKGSTATPYVPHEEQTYSIYTQQPFRSVGDVRDCFVKINGVWNEKHLPYIASYNGETLPQDVYNEVEGIKYCNNKSMSTTGQFSTGASVQYLDESNWTYIPCTQSQIDILENIPSTFAGQTNVYSTDEVEPYLKIQYWESDTNG